MYRGVDPYTGNTFTISPQAWGCTVTKTENVSLNDNLPTGVGMYRTRHVAKRSAWQYQISPQAWGCTASSPERDSCNLSISPQAWGCTELTRVWPCQPGNLPTGVGMYLIRAQIIDVVSNLPTGVGMYRTAVRKASRQHNLPTGVGMYRSQGYSASLEGKSPHRRGDVPCLRFSERAPFRISPQAWGCTVRARRTHPILYNLPTGVGMYRVRPQLSNSTRQSPHRRGDVPI